MFTMSKDCKVTRVSNKVAAGTSQIDSARVDMTGFDSVIFVAGLDTSTATAVITAIAKSNPADSVAGSTTEKTGTAVTDAGGNQANQDYVVDLHRPQNRYAYCSLTRTVANVAVNAIYAIQYNAAKGPLPVSQPATTAPVDFGGPNA